MVLFIYKFVRYLEILIDSISYRKGSCGTVVKRIEIECFSVKFGFFVLFCYVIDFVYVLVFLFLRRNDYFLM